MSEIADKLAERFKPGGCAVFGGGKVVEYRAANGGDSTMIVFLDTDGYNSMRALTFNEIVDALKDMGVLQ